MPRKLASTALVAILASCLPGCGGPQNDQLIASAKSYLDQKNPKAASIQLKQALQNDPQSGEARFLLGKALLSTNDAAGAVVELNKAADLHYAADRVTPLLAQALLRQGEYAKLTDAYGATRLSDKAANADLETTVAMAWLQRGHRDDADKALADALAVLPDYAPALLLKARLAAALPDYAAALALVDRITAHDANNAEAWLLRGEILQRGQHDSAGALAAYNKAVALRNDLMAAHQAIVLLLLQGNDLAGAQAHVDALKKSLPDQPGTQFLEAQMAYLHHDYSGVRKLVQPLVQSSPNNPLVMQLAGATEFQLGSMGTARDLLTQALKLAPGMPLATRLLAQAYLRTGEPDKALDALRPALASSAAGAGFFNLAGQAYLQRGDAAHADEMFARAARIDPKDARARTALALGQFNHGDAAGAMGELESLSESDKGVTADLALVATHLKRKDYAGALKAIDGVARKLPGSPLPDNLRGDILALSGDRAGSRAAFLRSLASDKTYFPAAAGLAALDLDEHHSDAARKRFEDLVKADPKNFRAMLALASLAAREGGDPAEVERQLAAAIAAAPTEVAPRLQLINHDLGAGRAKAALSAAQDAVTAIPENPALVDALGRAQVADGDFEQAVTTYNKLEGMQSSSPRAALGLADAYRGAKNYDAQEKSLRHALEITPDLLVAQRGLIAMMVDDGRYDEAIAIARNVQKQRPAEATGWQLEGAIELRRRNWDAAIAALRTGVQKAPTPDAAIGLHQGLVAAGRNDEAQQVAAAWQKAHPQDAAYRFYLADRALAGKDWAGAETLYRSVLAIRPDNALALNNIAWLLLKQSRPGALELAQKANAVAPNQPALMDTLASALASDNQVPKALELQKRAIALAPNSPNLHLTLARLLIKSGDKAQARGELEKLSKLGSGFAGQDEVTQLLKGV